MAFLPATLVAFLGSWLVASSLWIGPHSLSYFNELICGPLNGPKHLLGSNVDWNQDDLYALIFRASHVSQSTASTVDIPIVSAFRHVYHASDLSGNAGFNHLSSSLVILSVNALKSQRMTTPPRVITRITYAYCLCDDFIN